MTLDGRPVKVRAHVMVGGNTLLDREVGFEIPDSVLERGETAENDFVRDRLTEIAQAVNYAARRAIEELARQDPTVDVDEWIAGMQVSTDVPQDVLGTAPDSPEDL